MSRYDIHIPSQDYWGSPRPMTLRRAVALGVEKGVAFQVLATPVSDGLNDYEREHPDRALVFDVETEDIVAVERTEP